jgi:anti-anti-sigma factor
MVTTLKTFELPGWIGLHISGRVDAFNDRKLIQSLCSLISENSRVALDLSQAEFLSLQVLTYLSSQSRNLGRNGGELVLVRPSHNVRRQIEIFLGPRIFRVYESREDLKAGSHLQPRAEFQGNSLEQTNL